VVILESVALLCDEAIKGSNPSVPHSFDHARASTVAVSLRSSITEVPRNEIINAAILENIFETHYKRVYNFCAYRINNHHDTEDLVSTVFEKVITKYGTYRPSSVPLEAWIIAIAKNVVNDYFRHNRKRAYIPIEFVNDAAASPSGDQPEEIYITRENNAALMRALNALTEKERTIVAMKFAASLKNVDIASIMSLSESNVGTIIHRSLKKMRRVLEGELS
jgi:RNA polymerase sigma-70 factor (ECF subfamily)